MTETHKVTPGEISQPGANFTSRMNNPGIDSECYHKMIRYNSLKCFGNISTGNSHVTYRLKAVTTECIVIIRHVHYISQLNFNPSEL